MWYLSITFYVLVCNRAIASEHKFDVFYFAAEESPQHVSDDQDYSISEDTEEQHDSSTEIRITVKEEEEDKGEKNVL